MLISSCFASQHLTENVNCSHVLGLKETQRGQKIGLAPFQYKIIKGEVMQNTCSVASVRDVRHSLTGRISRSATVGCVTLLRLDHIFRTHDTGSTPTSIVTSVTL